MRDANHPNPLPQKNGDELSRDFQTEPAERDLSATLAATEARIVALLEEQRLLIRANEKLRQQNLELASAAESAEAPDLIPQAEVERRRNEFLATLAHELRGPIAPIRNAVEILVLAGDDPGTSAAARDVLNRQVRQLARIIDDVIDVSRIVERKVALHLEQVLLSQVVEIAVESARSRIEACGQHLTVALPEEPVSLEVDPSRISQVLTNLLDNAAKFTPEGGKIRLQAEQLSGSTASAEQVEVRVLDTGVGISSEILPHVFDLYFQGDPFPEKLRSGLGVGLTLVRSLVQMHGGEVEARSEGRGTGSEVVVRLPLTPTTRSSKRGTVNESTGPASTRGSQRSSRILVVDDNEDQAETLARLLRVLGHEARVAYDGLSAIDAAREFVPELALIDIGLPGQNGFEVARALRQEPNLRHTVLAAQTGWGQEEDRRRSAEAGFDHHLVKPLDLEVLRKILAELPARPAGADEGSPGRLAETA